VATAGRGTVEEFDSLSHPGPRWRDDARVPEALVFRIRRGPGSPEREAWAARVLHAHVAEDGWCLRCLSAYGARVPWPCRAAQVASLFGHGPVLDPGEATNRPPTSDE